MITDLMFRNELYSEISYYTNKRTTYTEMGLKRGGIDHYTSIQNQQNWTNIQIGKISSHPLQMSLKTECVDNSTSR